LPAPTQSAADAGSIDELAGWRFVSRHAHLLELARVQGHVLHHEPWQFAPLPRGLAATQGGPQGSSRRDPSRRAVLSAAPMWSVAYVSANDMHALDAAQRGHLLGVLAYGERDESLLPAELPHAWAGLDTRDASARFEVW